MGRLAAALRAARFQAAVDAAILAPPIRAATLLAVDAAILAPPIRAAILPAVDAAIPPPPIRAGTMVAVDATISRGPIRAAVITVGTEAITPDADTPAEEATTLAVSTRDEVITTADASGLVRTLALGSASPSAGATIRMRAAVTTTDGAIGSRLRAMWTTPTVTVTATDRT